MAKKSEEHIKVLKKLDIDVTQSRKSPHQLRSDKLVIPMFSNYHENIKSWWFGLHEKKLKDVEQLFILFICSSENQVFVIPATYLSELFNKAETAKDGTWKIRIFKELDKFEIQVSSQPRKDITLYLNRYELLNVPQPITGG
jgi:hypothetical protein